jgi:carbonic anhydrase/acetyltransferase-like protein (isoleucine patch superfamily)
MNIFIGTFIHFAKFIFGHYCLARLRGKFARIKIDGPIIFKFDSLKSVEIGNDIYIGPFSEIIVKASSISSSVQGRLVLGDRVVIGKGANIRAAGGEVRIGEGSLLAQNVSLIAANHSINPPSYYRDEPWDQHRVGVTINRNVWIGTGAIVLPGVTIGENSVIAAGAVVTKNIPSNQIWAGIPAKCIKQLNASF